MTRGERLLEAMFKDAGFVDPGNTIKEGIRHTDAFILLDRFLGDCRALMEPPYDDVDLSESYFDLMEYVNKEDE